MNKTIPLLPEGLVAGPWDNLYQCENECGWIGNSGQFVWGACYSPCPVCGGKKMRRRGRFIYQRKPIPWLIHFGPIPAGLFVLHTCDHGLCVRPDHLFLGTQGDNMRDMCAKGRQWLQGRGHLVTGEDNPKARLTWPIVEAIRAASKAGAHGADLARQYEVTKENIYAIVKQRTWKTAS